MAIVLASQSPRRQELLARIGVEDFKTLSLDIDESYPEGLSPEDTVRYIAKKKCDAAAALCAPDDLIITADTMVFLGNDRLGKPRDEEDALRMLRTIRFSAQLGFDIEPRTMEAVREFAPLAASLSAERVRDELVKTLRSPRPDVVWQLVDFRLLDAFLSSGDASAERPALSPAPKYARLARFCLALELGGYIMSTSTLLTALRFDSAAVRTTASAVEILRSGRRDWKRLLRDYGEPAVLAAHPKNRALREVLRSGECWALHDLAIGGAELKQLGYSGPELGRELDRLLNHVIDHPADNRADILCKLAERKVMG